MIRPALLDGLVMGPHLVPVFGVAWRFTWQCCVRDSSRGVTPAERNVDRFGIGASMFASNAGSENVVIRTGWTACPWRRRGGCAGV